jgi:hypothetical protein
MKKNGAIGAVAVFLMSILFLDACQIVNDTGDPDSGGVSIALPHSRAADGTLPGDLLSQLRYHYELVGRGGRSGDVPPSENAVLSFNGLAVGNWELTLTAYYDRDGAIPVLVGTGTTELLVVGGQTASASIGMALDDDVILLKTLEADGRGTAAAVLTLGFSKDPALAGRKTFAFSAYFAVEFVMKLGEDLTVTAESKSSSASCSHSITSLIFI